MDQSTTPKRKPGRPRKQKPAAGIPNTQTPESNSSENPLEATIKAARKAYDPQAGIQSPKTSKASESPKETQGQANTSQAKDSAMGGLGQATGEPTGAAISSPSLPVPRARGKLTSPESYVKLLTKEQLWSWAASWLATGNRREWICCAQPQIGRENDAYKAELFRQAERLPDFAEACATIKQEMVMDDLARRKLLKEIAHAPEHGLRGFADNLKAIELDSKADPESVENKRKSEAANSLTFNAPVSLFFMPSTQARAIQPAPESKQAEAIEVQTRVASSSLPTSLPSPLPPVGGGPAD